jgi:hypothetical protein
MLLLLAAAAPRLLPGSKAIVRKRSGKPPVRRICLLNLNLKVPDGQTYNGSN